MDTLTKKEFEDLTKTEQVVTLFRDGEEIFYREEESYDIHLYTLSDIFVELWYQKNTKKIMKVEITEPESILKNYKNFELTDIF